MKSEHFDQTSRPESLALADRYIADQLQNPRFDIEPGIPREAEMRELAAATFRADFLEPYRTVLEHGLESRKGEHVDLRGIIDTHLSALMSVEPGPERIAEQKRFVESLVAAISSVPGGHWYTSIKHLTHSGKANCVTASALLQLILESTASVSGIEGVNYGNPAGHVMNIVPFEDGSIYYADPANYVFEDIAPTATIEERGGFTLYSIPPLHPRIPFRYVPAYSNAHNGITSSYLGNFKEIIEAVRGSVDPQADATLTAEELDQQFKEAEDIVNRSNLENIDLEFIEDTMWALEGSLKDFANSSEVDSERTLVFKIRQARSDLRIITRTANQLRISKDDIIDFLLGTRQDLPVEDAKFQAFLVEQRPAYELLFTLTNTPQEERRGKLKAFFT